MEKWTSGYQRVAEGRNNLGSRISNPAFLAFKTSPVRRRDVFSWAEASGEQVFLRQPRVTVGPGSHRLNSDEVFGLRSALFLSSEWFHALILPFLSVWFPWKCRPLGNGKALHHEHRHHVLFWDSKAKLTQPTCRCEPVLVGAGRGAEGRCDIPLSY